MSKLPFDTSIKVFKEKVNKKVLILVTMNKTKDDETDRLNNSSLD